jgi:hypothetical protein
MSRNRTKWCLSCGRKRVIHNPDFFKDDKPFKCLECGFKHSHKDLGLVKKDKGYIVNDRVTDLSRRLRLHCHRVFLEKRGVKL